MIRAKPVFRGALTAAAAVLLAAAFPLVGAQAQTAAAPAKSAAAGVRPDAPAVVDLDSYYRYPFGFGAEYQALTAFGSFASGFVIRDVAAEFRLPISALPSLQPFLRAGSLSFTEIGSTGAGKWDHTDYYGALGASWAWRFAKNFEIGLDLSGGLGQSAYSSLSPGAVVGSLDVLGSVGARIGLIPLFNMVVEVRPTLRYLRTLGPLTEFDGFSFGVGFAVDYRFGEDPDSPAALIRSLRLSSGKLPPVFAAMQSYYATNPIGTVTLTNTESFPVTDLEVSFFQPGYMDSPTPVASIAELSKGAEAPVGILAAFSQEIFRTEGTTPLAGELVVRYRAHGRPVEQRLAVSYDLYDRTSITWDDDRKVGAFITPADAALRNYVSFIRQAVKDEALPELNGPLQTAAEVFAALGKLGIIYQSDPSSPFTRAQGNALLVDSVNVARDTLKRGTGDCDDLTVLFTSLLETTGVQTGFVTVPGHIYAAFNTRVPARDYVTLHPERGLFIAVDGELWVPVEITLIGTQSFQDAWRKGAELWKQFEGEAAKRRFIRTAAAQEIFRPVGLRETDLGLQYGSKDELAQAFRQEMAGISDSIIASMPGSAKNATDKKDLNALGVALARFGRYKEAEAALTRALRIDPSYAAAQINLGNIAYLGKDYRKAIGAYKNAERTLAGLGKTRSHLAQVVLVSMSKAYRAVQDMEQSRVAFDKAQSIDPEGVKEFGYLAKVPTGDGSSRAGDQAEHVVFTAEE
jgi:tetratricopeptide (TPR) repeat protein